MQPGVERAIVFVSDHGHTIAAAGGSPRQSVDERFPIGSVTKSFTATIVLQLVQEKKLRLDNEKVLRFDEIVDALCQAKGFKNEVKEYAAEKAQAKAEEEAATAEEEKDDRDSPA